MANIDPFAGLSEDGRLSNLDLAAEARKAFARKQLLRDQGVESAYDVAEAAKGGITALEDATKAGRSALRSRAADALAATLGQTGAMPTGGGQLAALRQTAMDRGQAEAGFEASQAMNLAQARQDAAAQRLEAIKFEREAGSVYDERIKKQAAADAQIEAIIEKHRSLLGDDTDAMAREVNRLAQFEEDPVVRAYLQERARTIRANSGGFFGFGREN